jgi:hypothetical protein
MFAQGSQVEVCKALLAGGIYDKYQTFTNSRLFSEVRRLLATESFSTFESAQYTQTDLGLGVLDILSASFGGTTDSSNYAERRTKFLASDFSKFSSDSNFMSHMEVASVQLAGAFVACVDKTANVKGFSAWVTPSKNLSAFSITARHVSDGNPQFTVTNIPLQPAPGAKCDIKLPQVVKEAMVTISCSKPASSTIQVSMNTSAGVLAPQDVEGLDDALVSLRSEVASIRNGGALVPRGSVAFFELTSCPPGWKSFEQGRGRYLVGLVSAGSLGSQVGTPLADKENRATGKHDHKYQENGWGWGGGPPGACTCDGGPGETKSTYTSQPSGETEGTNAPYVQLLACQKQ